MLLSFIKAKAGLLRRPLRARGSMKRKTKGCQENYSRDKKSPRLLLINIGNVYKNKNDGKICHLKSKIWKKR